MEENICRFPTNNSTPDTLHILNLVQEADHQKIRLLPADYKLCLVSRGSGEIVCRGHTRPLSPGDLFLLLPSVPYNLTGSADFTYLYISFIGARANQLVHQLGITWQDYIFPDNGSLLPFWREGLLCEHSQLDLLGESILLHAFSRISSFRSQNVPSVSDSDKNLLLVKKYIDDHLADPLLHLEQLSQIFSYNPKYLSSAFRKFFHICIRDYILSMRITRACGLMEQGYTSMKEISILCGFSDPLYFSKVFKKRMGLSPRGHLQQK